jgi:hypothetical protein
MQEIQRLHATLKAASDACCGGDESAAHVCILDTLEQRDT